MKTLRNFKFDPRCCRKELDEFGALLHSKKVMDERKDILPFFRAREHLSAFMASYIPDIVEFDRLAFEYSLFGDFTCDLVVGDSKSAYYCFIESLMSSTV